MQPDLGSTDPLDHHLTTRVNVGDSLSRMAAARPDAVAVIDGDQRVTYRRLNDAAERIARGLLDLGIDHQEPVGMLVGNRWEFFATFYGCAKAGLVALPVNIALTADDVGWILADAGVRHLVVDQERIGLAENAIGRLPDVADVVLIGDGDAVAGRRTHDWHTLATAGDGSPVRVRAGDQDTVQCLYTSGTTSRPKGVLVSHVSLQIAVLSNNIAAMHRWDEPPVSLVMLPLFHTTANNVLSQPALNLGGTVLLAPFDPDDVLDLIERERVTHLMMLPMMHAACVQAQAARPRDTSSVRLALYAMAPMPDELLTRVSAMYPNAPAVLGSGQTEVVPVTVMQQPEHERTAPTSWGVAAPTVLPRIMEPGGDLLPDGETGEIVYRGPNVCTGYWNNPAANEAAFDGGWFHSGDVGHRDADGVVWFTDRLKDIIKSGGENVSSVLVERVVGDAPGVAEACAIGVPHERWGEAVCAVVVPDGSVPQDRLPETVLAHARERLAGFQVPKEVRVVPAFARTATGKIRKQELRREIR